MNNVFYSLNRISLKEGDGWTYVFSSCAFFGVVFGALNFFYLRYPAGVFLSLTTKAVTRTSLFILLADVM